MFNKTVKLWYPIRKSGDDGHEFVLPSEWGADFTHAKQRAEHTDQDEGWARANSVTRIAQVQVTYAEIG